MKEVGYNGSYITKFIWTKLIEELLHFDRLTDFKVAFIYKNVSWLFFVPALILLVIDVGSRISMMFVMYENWRNYNKIPIQ